MTDVLDATKAKREVFMHRYRKSGLCTGVNKWTYMWEVWKWLQRQYGYFNINRWEQGNVHGTFCYVRKLTNTCRKRIEKHDSSKSPSRLHTSSRSDP